MALIIISVIIQFSLESKINPYTHIEEELFRSLLTILQPQLNILLEKFQILEERNEIYRYTYHVMRTLDLKHKLCLVEAKKTFRFMDRKKKRAAVPLFFSQDSHISF